LITQKNGLILPRRAFRDDEDFEKFMTLARHYDEGTADAILPQTDSISPHPTQDGESRSLVNRESERLVGSRLDNERRGERKELSFVLTVEDHIAFNMLLHSRQPFWRRYLAFLMMSLVVPIGAFMLFSVTLEPQAPPEHELILKLTCLGMVSGFAAIIAVFQWRMQLANIRRQVRTLMAHPQNQKLVSEMTVSMTPEELVSHSMWGTNTVGWERVEEIVVTEDHAFFFLGERSALILPKRPLQEEEFEEFVELARQYHEGNLSSEETVRKAREPEQEFRIEE
jgi:YcxB-like protein